MQRCQAAAEDLRDRGLQPGVRVADGELHADQAAGDEAAEELGPERFGLGLADVDREDLPPPALMDAVRDDERLGDDAAAVADLLHLGVQEQVGVAALQRPRPERLDVLIQRLADAADVRLGDPQPEPLDELVDAPRRDAAAHRPAGPPPTAPARSACAAPESSGSSCPAGAWGSAAPARRRGCPSAAPDSRCDASPDPRAAARHAGADQLGHLELHHLRRDGLDRLADHVGVLIEQHLPDDLLDRHPVGTGHAAPPFIVEP